MSENKAKGKWTAGYWMSKSVEMISPQLNVVDAFVKMRREGYRHLLVVDKGILLGMVTDRDLRRPDVSDSATGWDEFYNLDSDRHVRSIMATDIKTVKTGDDLESVLKIFISNKYGALPVVDDTGEIAGILTRHDLLVAFFEAMNEWEIFRS